MAASTVLCVDPEDTARTDTCTALQRGTDLAVVACDSLAAARESLVPSVDCVVTEYRLPDGTGIELADHVCETAPDTAFVLFTDDTEPIDVQPGNSIDIERLAKNGDEDRRSLVRLINHLTAFRGETEYPLPQDEEARLAALEQYVDAPESLEGSLNRLSTLAGGTMDVPMAAISVIDANEQRFLSCFGMDTPSVDREETVCTFAMLDEGVTVIEDLLEDPRFAGNEGIRRAGLRAYASANLTTPEGHVIGTFCLYDDEPRSFDADEREWLQLFADEAMDQIRLRQSHTDGNGSSGEPGP